MRTVRLNTRFAKGTRLSRLTRSALFSSTLRPRIKGSSTHGSLRPNCVASTFSRCAVRRCDVAQALRAVLRERHVTGPMTSSRQSSPRLRRPARCRHDSNIRPSIEFDIWLPRAKRTSGRAEEIIDPMHNEFTRSQTIRAHSRRRRRRRLFDDDKLDYRRSPNAPVDEPPHLQNKVGCQSAVQPGLRKTAHEVF